MKRMLLLVTVALMLAGAMALTGVAQAKSPIGNKADAKCLAEASKTLQPGFNFSDYTFIGGTEGHDVFTGTAGPEVFCGFGGVDQIDTLAAGDIFLGGADVDTVSDNFGTYYGGAGSDIVFGSNESGATFYGGEGNDQVLGVNDGTFYGGAGNDEVSSTNSGTFYGQEGDDHVQRNIFGFFDGGDGTDSVFFNEGGGTIINVEQVG
jgi:hypothetical protein